ncbi:hypothetical protein CkaCkLH20_04628 [Colletotrichum karsti]|uniref:Uncharacterized protein n=1 Tax=Colletotrichum karsti TaxID=1095194 RepID=A0A9P6I6Z5_9PEZI|nr:uncharacterized protein CkaCkLH20_04628 [Colletotrichum karsti]KAF9878052.1 hypothetical protein CkaCkLH20_04628 [Colletotrichum karsti]
MELTNLQGLEQPILLGPKSSCKSSDVAFGLWGIKFPHRRDQHDDFEYNLETYMTYYYKQISLFAKDEGKFVVLKTHQDIANIANDLLRQNLGKDEMIKRFHTNNQMDEIQLYASTNLTARLIFMMCIGTAPLVVSGGTDFNWIDNENISSESIKDSVARHFNDSRDASSGDSIQFSKLLTAQNLRRIVGLKILWTDNIADHLRLFRDDTEVAIFHHASFLMVAKHA